MDPCCVGQCCGPGSYCCQNAGPHTHEEEERGTAFRDPADPATWVAAKLEASWHGERLTAFGELELAVKATDDDRVKRAFAAWKREGKKEDGTR